MTEKYDAFISYSRADYQDIDRRIIPNNVISKIKDTLDSANITYWIDETGISAGDEFAPIIAKAIKNSSVFVFVSTERSNKSEWTQSEISVARICHKTIIPFKCDDSPYADSVIMYLAALDMCDYKTNPELALRRLVQSIKDNLPSKLSSNTKSLKEEESTYKRDVLNGIASLNEKIVEISQLAINKMLYSNEQTTDTIKEFQASIQERFIESSDFNEHIQSELIENQRRLINDQQILIDDQRDNSFKLIDKQKENSVRIIEEIIDNQDKNTSQMLVLMESINDNLQQMNRNLLKISNLVEITSSQLHNLSFHSSHEITSNLDFIELIFIIDCSGSMYGKRSTLLNESLKEVISELSSISQKRNSNIKLSVLEYSSVAAWQYSTPLDIEDYKWIDIEGKGITNYSYVINKLSEHMDSVKPQSDQHRIICLFSDGTPTDEYSTLSTKLYSSSKFKNSYKIGIGIGEDYDESFINEFVEDNGTKIVYNDREKTFYNELGNFGSLSSFLITDIVSYINKLHKSTTL